MSKSVAKNSEQVNVEKFNPHVSATLRKDGGIYICAQILLKGIAGVPDEPYLHLSIEDNVESIGSSNYSGGPSNILIK